MAQPTSLRPILLTNSHTLYLLPGAVGLPLASALPLPSLSGHLAELGAAVGSGWGDSIDTPRRQVVAVCLVFVGP